MTDQAEAIFDESPAMFRTSLGWFLFFCLLVPVVIGIVALLIWKFRLNHTRLTITGQRVLYRTGIFSTTESEVRVSDVRDIEIHRTLMQRLCGTGTLSLSTAGESGMEIEIAGLREPQRVREMIHTLRS
ncbi:MAG TPA: PH domain-containing protein [Opitutaceae bacterium]|nr:PH domain-containing protein [Opitutaceae bacterium]